MVKLTERYWVIIRKATRLGPEIAWADVEAQRIRVAKHWVSLWGRWSLGRFTPKMNCLYLTHGRFERRLIEFHTFHSLIDLLLILRHSVDQ